MPVNVCVVGLDNDAKSGIINQLTELQTDKELICWHTDSERRNGDYILYLIHPDDHISDYFSHTMNIKFLLSNKKKLVVGCLISHNGTKFSTFSIQCIRKVTGLVSELGIEVFYNLHDIVFHFEELGWRNKVASQIKPEKEIVYNPEEED